MQVQDSDLAVLETFVLRAKQHTYVGNGTHLLPYRFGSHDLQYHEGEWVYHDSYVGESDFIGQEIVYWQRQPVWGMNYYGIIVQPERLTSAQAGSIIKQSLTHLYEQGRFLGGWTEQVGTLTYVDLNEGDVRLFHGQEAITANGLVLYELRYHGGLLH